MEVCWPETATSFKRPPGLQLTVPDGGYYDKDATAFATSCQHGEDSTPINQSVEIFFLSCSSSRAGAARRLSPLGWSALGRDAVCEELNHGALGARQGAEGLLGAPVTHLGVAGPSSGPMPALAPGEGTQRGPGRRRRRSASWAELPSTNPLWEQEGGASGHELHAPSCHDEGQQEMEGLVQLARSPVARPKRGGGECLTYSWDFSGCAAASCLEGEHEQGVHGEAKEEPAEPEGLCRSPVARPRRTQLFFRRGSVAMESLGLHSSANHEPLPSSETETWMNSETETQMIEGPPTPPSTRTDQNMTAGDIEVEPEQKTKAALRAPRRATWRRHSIGGGPETATCLLPSSAGSGSGSGGALRPCIRFSSGECTAPALGNRTTSKRVSFEENILRTVLIRRLEAQSPSSSL